MKIQKYSMIIIYCLFLVIGVGCSSNIAQEKIPEPLIKAIEQINQGNLDMGLKYLDLTIQDYPNSQYLYDAHLLRSCILWSKITSISSIIDILSKGITRNSTGMLYKQEDLDKLKQYNQDSINEFNSIDIIKSILYIYNNYTSNKHDVFKDIVYKSDVNIKDLSFFANYGYPVPIEYEINDYKEGIYKISFQELLKSIYTGNKINYPNYFYHMVNAIDNKELKKQLLSKVIELTESDKYNQTRIKAQEALKQLK